MAETKLRYEGMLVLVDVREPVRPSRWCKVIDHLWTVETTRRGVRTIERSRECERCGAREDWEHIDELGWDDRVRLGLEKEEEE